MRSSRRIRATICLDVSTSAKKKGAGWVIDGEKFVVLNGESADMLVVTARTKGGQRDKAGIGVFLVPGNAKGVVRKGYPTQDGLHAADITLTGVEVGADAAIGDPENGLPLIERVVDDARIALCAEAVGLMDESLKTTVEYLKTRTQFGVPIGSFQTLQHRAADMFVAVEQARSMSMFATMAADFDDAKERATAVAAAKVQIGKSSKFISQPMDPAPWRHRHDHEELQDRPLLQAAHDDRKHFRRHGLSPAPRHRQWRADVIRLGRTSTPSLRSEAKQSIRRQSKRGLLSSLRSQRKRFAFVAGNDEYDIQGSKNNEKQSVRS